jgi:ComF family protein
MSSLAARALALVVPSFCWECGADARAQEPLCAPCRRRLRWLEPETVECGSLELWSPVAYEGPARALVRALKYRGAAGLAAPIASQIVAGAPPGMLDGPATLVPVPLHPRRLRRGGFNQAARIAREVHRRTGLPVVDCLARRGPATRQVGRDRAERLGGPAGAVTLRRGVRAPARAVLVDDVATTGATLEACAAALREAGTSCTDAVTYARTLAR